MRNVILMESDAALLRILFFFFVFLFGSGKIGKGCDGIRPNDGTPPKQIDACGICGGDESECAKGRAGEEHGAEDGEETREERGRRREKEGRREGGEGSEQRSGRERSHCGCGRERSG